MEERLYFQLNSHKIEKDTAPKCNVSLLNKTSYNSFPSFENLLYLLNFHQQAS